MIPTLETFAANGIAAQKAVDQAIAEAVASRPRTLNPTAFINRAAVRDFLLDQARSTRTHKFERVSSETLQMVNEAVRQYCIALVRRLPSKGKTI